MEASGDGAASDKAAAAMKSADYKHVQVVLRQLETGGAALRELWDMRKLKLDLCLQLRMFEREALEVSV